MTAAGTATLRTDTYLSAMIITRTDIRETLIKRVTLGRDPTPHLATAKTIASGITTGKTVVGTIVTERNTENWMTTGVESTGQAWKAA